MPSINPSHYEHLINIGRAMTEAALTQLPGIPSDRYPIAYFGMGLDGINAAVGYLMLGHIDEARAWFRQCADYFLRSEMLNPDTVVAEKRALECALFVETRHSRPPQRGRSRSAR